MLFLQQGNVSFKFIITRSQGRFLSSGSGSNKRVCSFSVVLAYLHVDHELYLHHRPTGRIDFSIDPRKLRNLYI